MNAVLQDPETLRMDPEPTDELVLAHRAAAGDDTALEEIYEQHADGLFAYIFHALDGARDEAEEVWQDTLTAAVRSLNTYRGDSRLFSWLCSIARHKLADHTRRRCRAASRVSLLPPEDLNNLIDRSPLPDEIVSQRATCLRVVEVLGQLPPEYQKALLARYADGHSVEHVAQVLDKSYKAAESTLSRAKQAFRTLMESQAQEDL